MTRKVVLVTGASRGLGRAIAIQLAKAGYDLAVNYRENEAAAREAAGQCADHGARAEVMQADVADYEQCLALVERTRAEMGGLYGVVANAGISPGFAYVQETAPETWRRVMDVNVNGVYNPFHAAAPHLVEQGAGRLIALSSLATRYLNPGFGAYAASKLAVEGLVAVMGKELAQFGVLVTGVAPGLFDTDMGRGVIDRVGEEAVSRTIPAQRLGRPEEVGDLVVFLMSDQAGYITGNTFPINGGGRGVPLRL